MKQFLMIALVAAMLLFGCAGSSAPPANQQPAPPAGNNAPPAPPAGNTSNQAPPTQTPPAATSAVDSLIASLKAASGWKVTYTISGTGIATPIEMTQYAKGTDKLRVDITTQGMETRMYKIGADSYMCSNTGTWTCFKYSGTITGADTASLQNSLESESAAYTVTADGTMQVAGVTATCYKVTSTDSSSRYCVSPEGVPLYVKSTATANGQATTSEMTATSYTPSASDSDFTPLPATPQDLPSMPSG